MKVITVNFMTCAVKGCKALPASFPLHFHDAELELQELDFEAEFIRNVIPRIDWGALQITANEVIYFFLNYLKIFIYCADRQRQLGFPPIPDTKPEGDALNNEQTLRDLHRLLLETQVMEGRLACGNCGHEYMIKEGIANFLLPSHLGLHTLKDKAHFLLLISLFHIV